MLFYNRILAITEYALYGIGASTRGIKQAREIRDKKGGIQPISCCKTSEKKV
jgi:hypothetical protein